MGRVNLAWGSLVWRVFGVGAVSFCFLNLQGVYASQVRDPRQLAVMVADFDGTVAHNVGNYILRRVGQPESVSPFFRISSLPEEVSVPVHDFEGNVGPRIGKRIGRIDERGRFTPSTSLEPVQLSNGETIVPGYYYVDLQTSFREFRPRGKQDEGFLIDAVEKKLTQNEPFLLDAFGFLSVSLKKEYRDRVRGAILTMRGHESAEMKAMFDKLRTRFKLGAMDWPLEAFVNLTNPSFYEFGFSKTKYLERLYNELADRVMQDATTPHYLVMFENDRSHLRDIDELFQKLSNQGVFANPVVPVLVNLVEQPVFENPDGVDWNRSPMQQVTKMSRVAIYWPGKIERTNRLSRVHELVLGVSSEEAEKLMQSTQQNKLVCSDLLVGGGRT
jgi:hypothetical protein